MLLYGREGLFAPVLRAAGMRIVFAFPGTLHTMHVHCRLRMVPAQTMSMPAGMALATLFVTLPFVAREVIPVLEAQVRPVLSCDARACIH